MSPERRPREALLLPHPRQLVRTGAELDLASLRVEPGPSVPVSSVRAIERLLRRAGLQLGDGAPALRVALDPSLALGDEGYELSISSTGVDLRARDSLGLLHGARTLVQWIGPAPERARVPGVRIADEPAFAVRGALLDVSRDKVPTMETLFGLVELLASWKVNHLELYFEHAFAYPGHETVWRDASPLTPDEVRALDAFSSERGVELAPCQNTLGHMHRWLAHERYRHLSECPDGIRHPFSRRREPYGLCATDPRSLELVGELVDALLGCFASRRFNACLDETLDLGLGRSAEVVAARGAGRVYADYARAVHRLLAERGARLSMWADVALEHPSAIGDLPADVTALVWGYEASHDFAGPCAALDGFERWVCPGTSAWNSATGRFSNLVANATRAAREGRAAGARGYLMTDWGDHGHWQPLCISYPGLALGAALAWNPDDERDPHDALPALLDARVFSGEALGAALCSLAGAHEAAGVATVNGTAPFFALHFAHESLPHPRLPDLAAEGLERVRAELLRALSRLPSFPSQANARLCAEEIGQAASIADLGCELGMARLAAGGAPCDELPSSVRGVLGERVGLVARRQEELWLARNRVGGMRDSLERFERVRSLFWG